MHVKFFVLLLKINQEKLRKHIPFQRILWSVLDQIYQWFLNLCHLKIQLIRPTFCSFTHSLHIWSLQKTKTHPVNIHQSMRGNVFSFFFLVQSKYWLFASSLPATDALCETPADQAMDCSCCNPCEHPHHFLALANPRCISYLSDHLFQSSSILTIFL